MDEILFELRDHAAGLNAGRWDYIFSVIKKFRGASGDGAARPGAGDDDGAVHACLHRAARPHLPPPRRACHRRDGGVHPVAPRPGGERASHWPPSARTSSASRATGSTAHGSRTPTSSRWRARCSTVCSAARPHQKHRLRPEVRVTARDLLDAQVPAGAVTEAGVRANVSVGLAYLASWLSGNGAAAINNLMEDAATAEISRSQLWQWRVHRIPLDDGQPLTADRYARIRDEELRDVANRHPRRTLGCRRRASRRPRPGRRVRRVPDPRRLRTACLASDTDELRRGDRAALTYRDEFSAGVPSASAGHRPFQHRSSPMLATSRAFSGFSTDDIPAARAFYAGHARPRGIGRERDAHPPLRQRRHRPDLPEGRPRPGHLHLSELPGRGHRRGGDALVERGVTFSATTTCRRTSVA